MRHKTIQNNLLEETLILHIVKLLPYINGYGVTKYCNSKGLMLSKTTVYFLISKMIDQEIVEHVNKGLLITRIGERRLLSDKCLLRQLVP